MARKKIALIGAGMIGGTLAHLAAMRELGDSAKAHTSRLPFPLFDLVYWLMLQDYDGKKWDEPGGLDCLGRGPLYRASRFLSPKTEWTPVIVFSTLAVLGALGALAAAAACDGPGAKKRVGRIAVPR